MTAVWIALGAVIGVAGPIVGQLIAQQARKGRRH